MIWTPIRYNIIYEGKPSAKSVEHFCEKIEWMYFSLFFAVTHEITKTKS